MGRRAELRTGDTVNGIQAISERIAQIQAGIDAVSAAPPARPAPSAAGSAAFSTALGQAVTQLSAAPATGPALGVAAQGLNADGIPRELAAYGNGRIPAAAMDPIGETGHKLWAPASSAFERLLSAAAADGVDIGITDSYRSYDVQVDVVRRKGLYSEGGLGATPGTSQHGWGMAVDLDLDDEAQAWMRTNAGRFGFVEDTPREPWHWGFHPAG